MKDNESESRKPIRSILVATDFSLGARAAFDYAVDVAGLHEADIHLVHAVDLDESMPPEVEKQIEWNLNDLRSIALNAGLGVRSTYQRGTPWDVLAEVERETDVDLIVVGTRGHNPWTRIFLGSKADRMIRVASAPVLAVHPDDRPARRPLNTTVVGIDFSEASFHAAQEAARLLGTAPAPTRLVLLHAYHCAVDYSIAAGGAYAIPDDIAERDDDVRVRLEGVADSLRTDALRVEVLPRYGYAVSAIDEAARELDASLIAVGTHGRSGLRRVFLGSVAERVLHHASCPVLVVRHPDDAVQGADAEGAQMVHAF